MIWTALWIAWGLAFVGIEGAALRNDNPHIAFGGG